MSQKYSLYLILYVVVMIFVSSGFAYSESEKLLKKTTDQKEILDIFANNTTETSVSDLGIKMIVSLLIVLTLIVGTVLLLKKFFPEAMISKDPNLKLIKVIEKNPITPKQSLYLVWAVDRLLVLAVNAGTISLLSEIKDQSILQDKLPNEFSDTLTRENLKFSEIYGK